MVELAKLQRAAGAKQIITFYQRPSAHQRQEPTSASVKPS